MQHDSKLLPNGNLAVFNNDFVTDTGTLASSIVMFSQPITEDEKSHIVWKLNCNFNSLTDGKSPKFGNITPLPNGHYLICMGSINSLLEIDDNKRVSWNCFTENSNDGKNWQPFADYRANFTTSLYPCYFSVESMMPSDTIPISKHSAITLDFKIINEGSNADSYKIILNNDLV